LRTDAPCTYRCALSLLDALPIFVPRLLLQEVAAEDHRERGAVGEVEKAEASDRDVELNRIDRDAEIAAFDAAYHHRANHLDERRDRKSTRLNYSHVSISYAVFCL